MMKRVCMLLLALCVAAAVWPAAAEGGDDGLTLDRVVILSRHNIRSPLTGKDSVVSQVTPHTWFEWTSRTGELSLRGAMLETTMGQYFRLWLEDEGLFPENYIPEEGAVRFYANGYQRTQATARYFSAGLLPVAVVPVECKNGYGQADGTFLPVITRTSDAYEAAVRAEIAERGGGSLMGYLDAIQDVTQLIVDVLDMDESAAWNGGVFEEQLYTEPVLSLRLDSEPTTQGSLKLLCSLADALVLQYYEEPDDLKAAFGHEVTPEEWRGIGSVLATYEKLLFTSPTLSVNLAHPMLQEICAEMNTEGRKLAFLCGHDSTITAFLAALGVEEYELPGAIEPTTPIGVKVVFSRWLDAEGNAFWRVNLVYQSVDQLRSIQPLSLDIPPMIVPISFEGLAETEDGLIPEADLMRRFEERIEAYDLLAEEYGAEPAPEEDLEDAA